MERLKNGAIILKQIDNIVLCLWEESFEPFVIWTIDENGNAFWGHYHKDIEDAVQEFREKTLNHRGSVELLDIMNDVSEEIIDSWLTEISYGKYLVSIEKTIKGYSWILSEKVNNITSNILGYGDQENYDLAKKQGLSFLKVIVNLVRELQKEDQSQ